MTQLKPRDLARKSDTVIYQTTDYSKFGLIKGNRDITDAHVRMLISSISKKNLLRFNPILVNERMEVIDGQHRLEAASILNEPIYYITALGARIEDVQALNAHQKQWTLKEYAESYAELGFKDYKILLRFMQEQDMPVSIAAWLLSSKTQGGHMTKFRAGGYVADAVGEAYQVSEKIRLFDKRITSQVRRSKGFVRAIRTIMRSGNVDWKRMEHKLAITNNQIPSYQSMRDYLREIEDIYNYKNQTVDRIY